MQCDPIIRLAYQVFRMSLSIFIWQYCNLSMQEKFNQVRFLFILATPMKRTVRQLQRVQRLCFSIPSIFPKTGTAS